jgi:hypothetical protein
VNTGIRSLIKNSNDNILVSVNKLPIKMMIVIIKPRKSPPSKYFSFIFFESKKAEIREEIKREAVATKSTNAVGLGKL